MEKFVVIYFFTFFDDAPENEKAEFGNALERLEEELGGSEVGILNWQVRTSRLQAGVDILLFSVFESADVYEYLRNQPSFTALVKKAAALAECTVGDLDLVYLTRPANDDVP